MLMMLASRFAKSGQSFVDSKTRRSARESEKETQLMLMMLAPRFAKSGQSFGRIAVPAVDSNTRRSARESERKPSCAGPAVR